MESFNFVKRGNYRKFLTSPRLEKLIKDFEKNGGKWEKFRIGKLFDISTGSLIDTSSTAFGNIPRVSVKNFENGILGLYNTENNKEARHFENFISVNFFGNAYYHNYKASVEMKVHVLKLKNKELNYRTGIFLCSLLNKLFNQMNFSYGNQLSSSKLKNNAFYLSLPVINNNISYDFMESCIRELEEEGIRKLNAYLKVIDLEDYNLTEQEQLAIDLINNNKIKFEEYKLINILNWQSQKEIDPLKIKYLTVCSQPKYPFYGQATINNGVISYENLDENVLNNKNGKPTILIHSNNQNCIYLETPFYLKDGHGATSVLQNEYLNELNAHFVITCIKKVITEKFSYNEKATKNALKNTIIKLPTKENNQIDYNFMNIYIRAIEKLVIKKVIDWRDKQIEKTRDVVQGYC